VALARQSVGLRELTVGGGPDAFDAPARSQKKSRRSQGNEGHQQSVFDQVLSLLVPPKISHNRH
jgi:hypothetical protein